MCVNSLIEAIDKTNEEGRAWSFNPETSMFRVQVNADKLDAVRLVRFGEEGDNEIWEGTLRRLNLQIEPGAENVFFHDRAARCICQVLWDVLNGADDETVWKDGQKTIAGDTTLNMLDFQSILLNHDLTVVQSGANEGVIGAIKEKNLHGKGASEAEVENMPTLVRFRNRTLTILAMQFRQVWQCETFQDMFLEGEDFRGETAAKLAEILIVINGIRVNQKLLLNKLLPAFRARVAVMGRGTAETEWPDFLHHNLKGKNLLQMDREEFAWVIKGEL